MNGARDIVQGGVLRLLGIGKHAKAAVRFHHATFVVVSGFFADLVAFEVILIFLL